MSAIRVVLESEDEYVEGAAGCDVGASWTNAGMRDCCAYTFLCVAVMVPH